MTEHLAAHVFARAVEHPEAVALRDRVADGWFDLTYADLAAQVRHICHGLIAAGLHPGDAVAIISDNRAEWLVAEMAILTASAVAVHLGPQTPVEELTAILRETEVRAAFVSGDVLLGPFQRLTGRLSSLRVVICFDESPELAPRLDDLGALALGSAVDELGAPIGTHGTFAWARMLAAPFDIATAAEAQRRRDAWSPDDVAFVDYTVSGAGDLRGVVLTHRSTLATIKALAVTFEVRGPLHEVATLPLHHNLQRGSSLMALVSGGSVALVGDLEQVDDAMADVRPSLLVTTMPVLRRLVQKTLRRIGHETVLGPGVVDWSREVAAQETFLRGSPHSRRSPVQRVRAASARAAVARRLADSLGGPKEIFVVAGSGAPSDLMSLLELGGIPAYRGWSVLECGLVATVNAPGATRSGSVGRPLPGLEITTDDEGQVLLRGAGLMRGYFGLPTETSQVLRDGWLHTGQIGRIDNEGYLHLATRLDDMIVTDSLRYVAPQPVEARLRATNAIADIIVVGDGRPCLAAIVEPDLEHARQVRAAAGVRGEATIEQLVRDPVVVRAVGDAIRTANESLSAEQRVGAFRLTESSLATLGGQRSMGYLRRQRIERACAQDIDDIYETRAADTPGSEL